MLIFCWAVLRWGREMSSVSLMNPRRGEVLDFFSQCEPSSRNGAKFWSRERVSCKFWRQFSNEFTVSILLKHHCYGVHFVVAMLQQENTSRGCKTYGRINRMSQLHGCSPVTWKTMMCQTAMGCRQNCTIVHLYENEGRLRMLPPRQGKRVRLTNNV